MAYFKHQHRVHEVRELEKDHFLIDQENLSVQFQALDSHALLLRQEHQQQPVFLHQHGEHFQIWYGGEYYHLTRQNRGSQANEMDHSDLVVAPLTGKVILVPVAIGTAVSKGNTLVVLESMKMETALTAPLDAVVKAVHCMPGDQVGNGQLLIELDLKKET